MNHYVDVHTHLTHEKFQDCIPETIENAERAGLGAIVVNGLEPISNRQVLELAKKYPVVKPALGIYPIDAINDIVGESLPFPVAKFDVLAEIDFIRSKARAGEVFAIGECGLDGYWVKEETFAKQEDVFNRLIDVAIESDIPIIIHTRKLEARAIEILRARGVKRANFHCFGGKVKLALQCAEKDGYYFSIPANADVNEGFRKMLKELPAERILTETDAPFLARRDTGRSEPANVVKTVELMATLRGISTVEARDIVWNNFKRLFVL